MQNKVIFILRTFNERFEFELSNTSGARYSIVEDLVLWLTVRNNYRFGQVIRSGLSLKSRRVIVK